MTDALPISRFPVPDLADMPDDIKTRILAVRKKSGLIPNVFLGSPTGRTSFVPSSPTTTR